MANGIFFLVIKLITFDNILTNLCNSDIELRKCCGRCFGAVPALRRRESVGFAFLRSDERLYEVGAVNDRLIETATFRSPRNRKRGLLLLSNPSNPSNPSTKKR